MNDHDIGKVERKARRDRLRQRVDGPLMLMGNGLLPRNLPLNKLPFRQDSSLLYYTGCHAPNAVLVMDPDPVLYVDIPGPSDALWHGESESIDQMQQRLGIDIADRSTLKLPSAVKTIAVADPRQCHWASSSSTHPLAYGREHGAPDLVAAIIEQRRVKSKAEIEQIRQAADLSRTAFETIMGATKPGASERGLHLLFESCIRMQQGTTGYDTILTQSGDILHNHDHTQTLSAGRLLLCDGGAELSSGYCADITRTWPVDGKFDGRQRAAYAAVLQAQKSAIARCTVGTSYRDVHDEACRVLAQFLVDEGLLKGSVDGLVERGAHALFYPHGTGHHLGLDVHDLENFGDLPSYPKGRGRAALFGLRYLRLDLPLQPGWVVTVEPGFYVVDAILRDPALLDQFAGDLCTSALPKWSGFGGIRIEDDVHITTSGPDVLSSVPKEMDVLEDLIGRQPTFEERLWRS